MKRFLVEMFADMSHPRHREYDAIDALLPILSGAIVLGIGGIISVIFNSIVPLIAAACAMAVGLVIYTLCSSRTFYQHRADGFGWRRVRGAKNTTMHLGHPLNTNDYKLCKKRANQGEKKRSVLRLPYLSR